MKRARSVRMCWKLPSMFIDLLRFRDLPGRSRFTPIPSSATMRIAVPPSRGRGHKPANALIDDQSGEHEKGGAVRLSGKDFRCA